MAYIDRLGMAGKIMDMFIFKALIGHIDLDAKMTVISIILMLKKKI